MFLLSDKLHAYLAKVEKETGRQVLIHAVQNVGLSGMTARYSEHPTHILIEVVQALQQDEQIEQSIAHEATHGLLAYAKGYCRIKYKHTLTRLESDSIGILATMIEDIVVNKIIQENSFLACSSKYLEIVKKETNALRKNQDYYQRFQNLFKDRFMVFRYIMAWGFLKYYDLDESSRKIIARFENDFRLSRPEQYNAANQIIEILLQHNIFTAEGYCQAISESLKLWELNDLVNIDCYEPRVG
jgi:predicted SprT family Zn-dependent metalloprotease